MDIDTEGLYRKAISLWPSIARQGAVVFIQHHLQISFTEQTALSPARTG